MRCTRFAILLLIGTSCSATIGTDKASRLDRRQSQVGAASKAEACRSLEDCDPSVKDRSGTPCGVVTYITSENPKEPAAMRRSACTKWQCFRRRINIFVSLVIGRWRSFLWRLEQSVGLQIGKGLVEQREFVAVHGSARVPFNGLTFDRAGIHSRSRSPIRDKGAVTARKTDGERPSASSRARHRSRSAACDPLPWRLIGAR